MISIKEQLVEILGAENVSDDPQLLKLHSRDKSFAKPMMPRLLVKVKNADEVQKIVQWANKTNTPLVPVSSGAPHYKGDTVPYVPEAVIVDLSGMKRIISINRQHRMAIVEPGVTYSELQAVLAKEGMTLSTSIAPKATKSVLTSVLEVEPRLNSLHQWNYIDPLRCTEVVWGDGNKMFTGEAGAGAPDLQKQWAAEKWQISGAGPMMLDFYRLLTAAQGSMGIVTLASLKCELLPKIHKFHMVPSESLEALIDFTYKVIKLRFGSELLVVNKFYLAALLGESTESIWELQDRLPAWIVLVGVAGRELLPEERVEAHELDIDEIAQQYGLKMVSGIKGVSGEEVKKKVTNPSGSVYWKDVAKGAYQDIFFSTTLDRTPEFIEAMVALAVEAGYPCSDIGIYIQPMNMGTSYHCEFNLPYNPDNRKEAELVNKLYVKASEKFSSMGAYYSRPYDIWARLQLNKDVQSAAVLKKVKGIFDPNNIMNPGKLDINF